VLSWWQQLLLLGSFDPLLSNQDLTVLYTKKHTVPGLFLSLNGSPSPLKTWCKQLPISVRSLTARNALFCFVHTAFSVCGFLLLLGMFFAGFSLVPLVSSPLQIPDIRANASTARNALFCFVHTAFSVGGFSLLLGMLLAGLHWFLPFAPSVLCLYFGYPYSSKCTLLLRAYSIFCLVDFYLGACGWIALAPLSRSHTYVISLYLGSQQLEMHFPASCIQHFLLIDLCLGCIPCWDNLFPPSLSHSHVNFPWYGSSYSSKCTIQPRASSIFCWFSIIVGVLLVGRWKVLEKLSQFGEDS